jgi:hypothetical protein
MELGTPLLLGCFILMNVGAVLGYFGIHWLWRNSIRHAAQLRKFRNAPFNSAVMANESCSNYQKFLEHRHPHEKPD